METIESRHKLAKEKINDISLFLLNEGKISSETAQFIYRQLNNIEDDVFSLFSMFYPKGSIEFQVGLGENNKKYVAEITINEL